MRTLFLVLLAIASAHAAAQVGERWKPSEHPTVVPRTIPGYTRPRRTLDLSSEFGGRISGFRATEGDHLVVPVAGDKKPEAGDWLVGLDDTFEKLAVDAAKARLDAAKAEYDIAVANQTEAERTLKYLKGEVKRLEDVLKAGGSLRGDELDLAKHKSDLAELGVKKAEGDVGRTKGQLTQATADHSSAMEKQARCKLRIPPTEASEIERLQTLFPDLDVAKDRLIDWVFEQRHVEAGTQVGSGQGIVRLTDVGLLKIELRLAPEEFAEVEALMKRDKHVPVAFSDGKTVNSVLARRDFEFDPVSRKRLVELWLPGTAAPEATGGLAVDLILQLRVSDNTWSVPDKFISTRNELNYVKLADGKECRVSVLRRQGDLAFISSDGIPADVEFVAYGR